MRRLLWSLACASALWIVCVTPAVAQGETDGPGAVAGDVDTRNAWIRLTEEDLRTLPSVAQGSDGAAGRYEYRFQMACSGTINDPNRTALCAEAVRACLPLPGPMHWVLRRLLSADGQPVSAWQIVGRTCAPASALGVRPTVTLADVQRAFASVPWARLSTGMQPPNNLTLVTVPVFYEVQWAAEGISPGEVVAVDPARMLGYHVDIRPVLVGYTYRFGDGSVFGPTLDVGGRYPDGGVTHAYAAAGSYAVRVDATLGAEFRIEGGSWARIPDVVTVPGVPTSMTVKTARAVLVQ